MVFVRIFDFLNLSFSSQESMTIRIDKLAVVHPKAQIGEECVIGPFCTIGKNVQIGARTKLQSHVVIDGFTELGEDCVIFPFATLGVQSQDLKYVQGSKTFTKIGSRNLIREFVSIHSGTAVESSTTVGNDCALLAHSHIAHNCEVGNQVILSHGATLGGHVFIGDYANIGGLCGVHQFCRIGTTALVAGLARVTQDVLPFTIAEGAPASMRVVNRVGMQRVGYSDEAILEVRRAFRTLFLREQRLEVAVKNVLDTLGDKPHIQTMLGFIDESHRGLARPDTATLDLNTSE